MLCATTLTVSQCVIWEVRHREPPVRPLCVHILGLETIVLKIINSLVQSVLCMNSLFSYNYKPYKHRDISK